MLSEPTFDRQPTVPRRQFTLRRSSIASRQPAVVRQSTVQECRATFERAMTIPSRRSTIMSDPTNVDPDSSFVSRVSSNSAISISIAEAPVVPSREATRILTIPSCRTTVITQREATMQLAPQTPEQESSSISSEVEPEPEPETESMPKPEQLRTRRATTVRTTTGLTGLTTSSSEPQEYGSMGQMQERAASHRATLVRAPTEADFELSITHMRQATELEEPQQYNQDEPEPEPLVQMQSRRASKVPTLPIETAASKPHSGKSTWSTEAFAEKELVDGASSVSGQVKIPAVEREASVVSRTPTAVSRTPTNLSRRPTRQITLLSRQTTLQQPDTLLDSADLPIQRVATEISRQPAELAPSPSPSSESTLSFVSSPDMLKDEPPASAARVITRKPTGVLHRATTKDGSPTAQQPSRQATTVSRQPTARDESPQSFKVVGRMVEHDSDSEVPQVDEQLEDVQVAPPNRKTTSQLSRKPTRLPTQRQAQEESVVSSVDLEAPSDVGPAPPSRKPTSQLSRQPTRVSAQREVHANDTPPADEEAFQPVSRAAETSTRSLSVVIEPEEVADLVRQPTAMSRKPTVSPKIGRQKTRFSPEVDEHLPPGLSSPSSPFGRDRKPSTAAPGIVAPPPQLIQRDRKPMEVERWPRKKTPNYPPEQQYPPAPAYPARDTPAWTKPDTYTPPRKPKPEPAPKKREFFGLGPKPRKEPQPVHRWAPELRYREPEPQVRRALEPYGDRAVEPFRHAAPGPVPGPPGGTLQRPRGYPTAPGHEPVYRAPAPTPVRALKEMTMSLDPPQPTLARTITTPGSHRSHRTAETTIQKPSPHQFGGTSKRRRKVRQSEDTFVRNLPILQPEPERTCPLVTRLASHPFVAKRRSPLAINLQRNKTFVTKRRPLLGLKRLHLNVGRRLTKNPLARAQYRERGFLEGLSAGTPAATPKRKGLRFRKRRRTGQETDERQKRSLKFLALRRRRVSHADRQEASQLVQQPQSKTAIADRRRRPRLLLNGRRRNRQQHGSSRQGGVANDALQNRKQRRARKRMMGISLPSLRRKTRETVPAEPVSPASALSTPDPSSRARMHQSPQSQGGERHARVQLRDTRDHQVKARVVDKRQIRTHLEGNRQRQVQERRKPSRERRPVQPTEDKRPKQQLPKQHEKARKSSREDPQLRLAGHECNAGRRSPG